MEDVASRIPFASSLTTRVPPELWSMIFAVLLEEAKAQFREKTQDNGDLFLTRPPTLLNSLMDVSLSCRFFYSIALPLRYESLSMKIGSNGKIANESTESVLFGDKAETILKWVKTVRMVHEQDPPGAIFAFGLAEHRMQPPAIVDRGAKLFLRMSTVSEVFFSGFTITAEMYSHMCRLPTLRRICFKRIAFDDTQDGEIESPDWNVVKLRAFTFKNASLVSRRSDEQVSRSAVIPDPLARFACAPTLTTLCLPRTVLQYPFNSMNPDMNPDAFRALTTLKASCPSSKKEFHNCLKFLEQCPLLEHFVLVSHFPNTWGSENEHLEVPASILPRLQTLEAPIKVAKAFVSGRPVYSVIVQNLPSNIQLPMTDLASNVFRPLALGSVPLRNLVVGAVQWNSVDFNDIAHSLSQLEYLHIIPDTLNFAYRITREGFPGLDRMIRLQELHISPEDKFGNKPRRPDPVALDIDRQILKHIDDVSPIKIARFQEFVEWQKDGDKWLPKLR